MKRKILFFILLVATGLMGCSKSDAEQIEGFAFVYMPQATVSDDGYAVPSGAGEYSYNFKTEGDELLIFLGIMKSGVGEDDAFSVDVVAHDNKATVAVVKIANGVVLPASKFTIPEQASVASGSNSGTFYMKVKKSVINDAANAGKKLVAAVCIENPSRYELSKDNTTTIVVIDVDAVKKFL